MLSQGFNSLNSEAHKPLRLQYSVVSGWRAKARALKENESEREDVKESTKPIAEADDDIEITNQEADESGEPQDKVADIDHENQDEDGEIDVGSHIGLVLEDEEIFGVIIEFDDDEGLVTIEEDGTGDLVTGYQDDMFLEDLND